MSILPVEEWVSDGKNMKQLLFLGSLVLFLATACYKNDDAFGGHSNENGNPVRTYMITLADDLIAASLEEFETALQTDPSDPSAQAFFIIEGNLDIPGSTWTLRRDCPLKGLIIRCLQADDGLPEWNIEYEGELELSGENYPTRFSMCVHQGDGSQSISSHIDWLVSEFNGERFEREGYRCNFGATSTLSFKAVSEGHRWYSYGVLYMYVHKGGDLIDTAYLRLDGPRSSASFTRL